MKYLGKATVQRLRYLGLSAIVSAVVVVPVSAQSGHWLLAAAGSKSAAAETAQNRHGGKVLKVEEGSEGGRRVYRVKLLLEGGRIKIVTVDASGGNAS